MDGYGRRLRITRRGIRIHGTCRCNVVSFSVYGLHPGEPSLFEVITLSDVRVTGERGQSLETVSDGI